MTSHHGPGPEIVPLRLWVENGLSAIFQAKTDAAFDTAFNNLLAHDARITVNGNPVTREEYKQRLQGEKGTTLATPELSFNGAVEVSSDKTHPENAGSVGLFYTAIVYHAYKIHDALASSTIHSSLNVTVVTVGEGVIPDRKVTTLDEVVTEEANPVEYK